MGIHKQVLKLILHENLYKKLKGNYLSIGKQSVFVENDEILRLLDGKCIDGKCKRPLKIDSVDSKTKNSFGQMYDHELLQCISDELIYNCLDISPYEGANIICDLNQDVKPEFYGKFDFIYDGGTMDNIFDPAGFIKNINRMLSSNGRIIHFNACGSILGGVHDAIL